MLKLQNYFNYSCNLVVHLLNFQFRLDRSHRLCLLVHLADSHVVIHVEVIIVVALYLLMVEIRRLVIVMIKPRRISIVGMVQEWMRFDIEVATILFFDKWWSMVGNCRGLLTLDLVLGDQMALDNLKYRRNI